MIFDPRYGCSHKATPGHARISISSKHIFSYFLWLIWSLGMVLPCFRIFFGFSYFFVFFWTPELRSRDYILSSHVTEKKQSFLFVFFFSQQSLWSESFILFLNPWILSWNDPCLKESWRDFEKKFSICRDRVSGRGVGPGPQMWVRTHSGRSKVIQ